MRGITTSTRVCLTSKLQSNRVELRPFSDVCPVQAIGGGNSSDEDILAFEMQIQSHAAQESQSASRKREVQKESANVAEFDFHRHLVKMTGNELFLSELNSANEKLFLALSQTKRTKDRQRHSATSHGEVAEALSKRKIDEGLDLLREHLRDSMRNSLVVMGLRDYLDELDLPHVI